MSTLPQDQQAELVAQQAKANQSEAGGDRKSSESLLVNLPKAITPVNAREEANGRGRGVAMATGVDDAGHSGRRD